MNDDDSYYNHPYRGKRLGDGFDSVNDDGSLRSPFSFAVLNHMRQEIEAQIQEAESRLLRTGDPDKRRTLQDRITDLKFELNTLLA